jgi:hypothetical protein
LLAYCPHAAFADCDTARAGAYSGITHCVPAASPAVNISRDDRGLLTLHPYCHVDRKALPFPSNEGLRRGLGHCGRIRMEERRAPPSVLSVPVEIVRECDGIHNSYSVRQVCYRNEITAKERLAVDPQRAQSRA